MSAVTEYVLKAADDERKLYQTQVRQNWLGPLQAVVLLAIMPLFFRHLPEYAPAGLIELVRSGDYGAPFALLNRTKGPIGDAVAIALLYPFVAVFIFARQMLPSFPRKEEKDLGTVANSFLKEEQNRLGLSREPIALLPPLEAQELILEIIRLRMLLELVEEINRLRKILLNRSLLKGGHNHGHFGFIGILWHLGFSWSCFFPMTGGPLKSA